MPSSSAPTAEPGAGSRRHHDARPRSVRRAGTLRHETTDADVAQLADAPASDTGQLGVRLPPSAPCLRSSAEERRVSAPGPQGFESSRGLYYAPRVVRADRTCAGRHHEVRGGRDCQRGEHLVARGWRRRRRDSPCRRARDPRRVSPPRRLRDRAGEGDDCGALAGSLRHPHGRPCLARGRRQRRRAPGLVPPERARARRDPRLLVGRVSGRLDRHLRVSGRLRGPGRPRHDRQRAD